MTENTSNPANISRRDFLKISGVAGASTLITTLGLAACTQATPQATQPAVQAPTVITPKEIRYWTWASSTDDNPRAKAQGMILDAFRAKYPNIKVTEEVIPWNELRQQLIQASAAGTAPDVSRQLDQSIGTLAEAEAILPLSDFVNSWSADRKQDFVYDLDDTSAEGKVFGFRQSVRPTNLLYYRTDLYPSAPNTWAEFQEFMVNATTKDVYGWLLPFSKSDSLNYLMQGVPPMYWALGGDFIDPATSKPTFHSEIGVKIFQWLQDLVYVHNVMPVGVATMDAEAANQQFMGGSVAALFSNSAKWGQWSAAEAIKGEVATTPFPNFTDDPSSPGHVNTAGAWALVMAKGAKTEEAWKFLEFMQSNEAEIIDAKTGGEIPTRKSTMDDPWFKTEEASRMNALLNWMAKKPHPATTLKIVNIAEFTNYCNCSGW